MTNQRTSSSPRRKRIFGILAVVGAVFAFCTVMKAFVCGKFDGGCPCQAASDQSDSGCSSTEEE